MRKHPEKPEGPKFFIYARKSTEDEARQVLSIDSQLDELRAFAQKESLRVVREYVEAKTAKEPDRPIFNEMMEAVENGEAEALLAWHPDRLSRNSIDGGRLVHDLDTGKLRDLKFPSAWFENTPQGKFVLSMALGMAKYYVDHLSATKHPHLITRELFRRVQDVRERRSRRRRPKKHPCRIRPPQSSADPSA